MKQGQGQGQGSTNTATDTATDTASGTGTATDTDGTPDKTKSDISWMKPDSFSNSMANSYSSRHSHSSGSTNAVKYGYGTPSRGEVPVAVRRSTKIDACKQCVCR